MDKGYNLGELISIFKRDISELIQVKIELLKLEMIEKTSKGISFLIFGVIIFGLISFALLFGFLALGFLFANWVGSMAGGFALVMALYILLLVILLLCRKPLLRWLTNLSIKEMDPDLMTEEEPKTQEGGRC